MVIRVDARRVIGILGSNRPESSTVLCRLLLPSTTLMSLELLLFFLFLHVICRLLTSRDASFQRSVRTSFGTIKAFAYQLLQECKVYLSYRHLLGINFCVSTKIVRQTRRAPQMAHARLNLSQQQSSRNFCSFQCIRRVFHVEFLSRRSS